MSEAALELWELMVPTVRNNGKPFRTRYHRVWDGKVRAITGGLTIFKPAQGQWVNPRDGHVFIERMIPVRIACTEDHIREIAEMTKVYYEQIKVFCYRVSDRVLIL